MAADFDKPALDDTYVNVLTEIRDNDAANAVMFNGVTVLNTPINAVQFAGGVFGLWDGGSFAVSPVAVGGGGTGATTAADARTALDLYSKSESDAVHMSVNANGSDINDDATFRTNLGVPSNAEAALNSDNLSNLASAPTSFDNIKQSATELSEGVVEKATAAEMRSGAVGKYPDASTIKANKVPIEIWTGSDTSVSAAEVLASSGFVVTDNTGVYVLSSGAARFSIYVNDMSVSSGTWYGTGLGDGGKSTFSRGLGVLGDFVAFSSIGSPLTIERITFTRL